MGIFSRKKRDDDDDAPKKRKGKRRDEDDDDDGEDDDDDVERVMFQGAVDGTDANLSENARLAKAGLLPAKQFVTDALMRRAERFRIEPKGKMSIVRMYVDGVKYSGGRMPGKQALTITQMLKLLAGLDIKERSIKQTGGLFAEYEKVKYVLVIEVVPTKSGAEKLVITVENLSNRPEKPDELGFPDVVKDTIQRNTSKRSGLIIACGPPSSGTTSTRFGMIRSIDAFIYSVYSIANTQHRDTTIITEWDNSEDADLETSVIKMKREEADVLLLNPLTDSQSAKEAFQLHNQLCFITEMTALDAAAGIIKLIEWTGNPKIVAEGLDVIISQKLIRTLCEKCKDAFRPSAKLIAKIGLPPETGVFYRPLQPPEALDDEDEEEEEYFPCETCDGVGYYGRTGIYEMIEMTDAMKALIASDSVDAAAIRKQARKEEMIYFQKEAIRLVGAGKTSLEEVQRLFRK